MTKTNSPIVIGSAQFTQHKGNSQPLDPLNLMVKTGRTAISKIGVDDIEDYIDSVFMVNINCWSYKDAPGELSEILGLEPSQKVYLPGGGHTPQLLVNRAAKVISSGKSKMVLITGAEAAYSMSLGKAKKIQLDWPRKRQPNYLEGKILSGINKFENKYKFMFPSCTYGIFETAIRAQSGRSIEEHSQVMGKLLEHYSNIASQNPYSWTKKFYTSSEITQPTPNNRVITHPYTKRMCANMYVDQSASVILTSQELGEELNIIQKPWIYLTGGSDLANIHEITQRPNIYDSPAAREGAKLALEQAGFLLNEINKFDIYSCFPSMVEIIKNELGIREQDPRDLTITGGLPFFGGPMSNYSLHSIVTAVDLIRRDPSLKIMIIANGGYNSKQSFGIYSTQPPVIPWEDKEEDKVQKSILSEKLPSPIEKANGKLEIEGYTIIYDRNGEPTQGIALGKIENDQRTIGFFNAEPELLLKLSQNELVGRICDISYNEAEDCNLITF